MWEALAAMPLICVMILIVKSAKSYLRLKSKLIILVIDPVLAPVLRVPHGAKRLLQANFE